MKRFNVCARVRNQDIIRAGVRQHSAQEFAVEKGHIGGDNQRIGAGGGG
jgi:hypothetical protein